MASLNDLPDLVLLEILSLLPERERVRNARVCRRWKKLARHPLTWRHAHLPLKEVRFKIIWHVLRCYIRSNLQSLHLQGYVQSKSMFDCTFHSIQPELFKVLGKKCPRLQRLSIRLAKLLFIPMGSLPRTLRRLEMHRCDISLIWMARKEDEGALPHLEQLVLDHVPTFEDRHLRRLTCFPDLRSLVLCGTYSITEAGLDRGLRELSHLQRIEVLGSPISTDSVLQAISRHLRNVHHIRVTVGTLTATGLEALEGLPKLASLSLLSTCGTGEVCLIPFAALLSSCLTLPQLRVLELQGQGWEGQEAEAMLKKGLPHCRVIVGAAPPETTDWWRYISNPKNSNKFPLGCLSSSRVGIQDPCPRPRVYDMSTESYRMTPAFFASIRSSAAAPKTYRFPQGTLQTIHQQADGDSERPVSLVAAISLLVSSRAGPGLQLQDRPPQRGCQEEAQARPLDVVTHQPETLQGAPQNCLACPSPLHNVQAAVTAPAGLPNIEYLSIHDAAGPLQGPVPPSAGHESTHGSSPWPACPAPCTGWRGTTVTSRCPGWSSCCWTDCQPSRTATCGDSAASSVVVAHSGWRLLPHESGAGQGLAGAEPPAEDRSAGQHHLG